MKPPRLPKNFGLPLLATFAIAFCVEDAPAQYRGLAYTIDSDNSNHLWAIDLSSGNATDLGAVGISAVEAIAFHPDGRLFGIDDGNDELVQIDPSTGQGFSIGSLGAPVTNPGFAIDSSGRAWLASDDTNGTRPFYSVDLTTGAADLEGDQNFDIQGLTAIGLTIYGVNGEQPGLFRVDTKKGAAILVGVMSGFTGSRPSIAATPDGNLVVLDVSGNLYTANAVDGSITAGATTISNCECLAIPLAQVCAYSVDATGNDDLFHIDLLTGAAIRIGNTGAGDLRALAFHPDGRLFGVDDSLDELFLLDCATGSATSIGMLGVSVSNPGLAIDPSGEGFLVNDSSNGEVYDLDLSTGAATFIGNAGVHLIGLAARGNELIGLSDLPNDEIVLIDKGTGAGTAVGSLTNLSVPSGGLKADDYGGLWSLSNSGEIGYISRGSGVGVQVADTIMGCDALAIPPGCGANPNNLRVDLVEFLMLWVPTEGLALGDVRVDSVVPLDSIPENPAGTSVQLTINGIDMTQPIVLDDKGRASSESGTLPSYKVELKAKKRTLSIVAGGIELERALGLPNLTGDGNLIANFEVRVFPPAPSEGGPAPILQAAARVPLTYSGTQDVATDGFYYAKKDGPNYTGFAVALQAKAKEVEPDVHDVSAKGTIYANGGGGLAPRPLVPSNDGSSPVVVLVVGDAMRIELPPQALKIKGEGEKAKWSYDKKSGAAPSLKKLSYSAKKGSFSFSLDDMPDTGIPDSEIEAKGGPTSHILPMRLEVHTQGGWQIFELSYELTRKDSGSGSWK